MSGPGDVPPSILDRLRPICQGLPEAYEEPAWIGIRWRIRKRTIAHVYSPGDQSVVMTFRVPAGELLGLTGNGFPYFRADWGHNVARAVLGDHTDWTEIAELLTDSYAEMAPKFLVARLALPPADSMGR